MIATDLRVEPSPETPGFQRASARIVYESRPGFTEQLWYDLPDAAAAGLQVNGNPWLAAMLPVAATLGESLRIEAPVDADLLAGARGLLEWWHYWRHDMPVVDIIAPAATARAPDAASRTAQFFSGGVDSWFTLLRHDQPGDPLRVDDLLTGWGLDVPLADGEAFGRIRTRLQAVADRMDKQLVPFATNIRTTRFAEVPWDTVGHGAAMATAALLVGHRYRQVLIPSSQQYREAGLWGSHYAIDHLYSSRQTRLLCDGSASTRLEKVSRVAASPAALSALRVCWRSGSDANCGHCEKCLRTMAALDLCGALGAAGTFAHARLELRDLRRVYCPPQVEGSLAIYYQEMRDEALRRGRGELARSLSRALDRSRLACRVERLAARMGRGPLAGRIRSALHSVTTRSMIR